MRKIWFLCTILLLNACGTGGGSGDSNGTGANTLTNVQAGSPTGKVEINIKNSPAKTVAAIPAAANLRLVITNPHLNFDDAPFRYIVDGVIPAGNRVTGLKFPIASGYVFELITYAPMPVGATTVTVNRMLKYAKISNVTVGATDTSVDLNLEEITGTFTFPTETVYSGALLGVITASLQKPTPLQSPWKLFLSTDATRASSTQHSTSGQYSTHISVKAPYVLTPGTLYGQGEFYINSALLDTTGTHAIYDSNTLASIPHSAEKNTSWTFNYPNPDFGDSIDLVKAPLDVKGIEINIQTGG